MFAVKVQIKKKIVCILQQFNSSAAKFIGLHSQIADLSCFSTLQKKNSTKVEKDKDEDTVDDYNNDDFEILKMSTQKNSIEDLQNQIFLQEYQNWIQDEQELYQELRNLNKEIFKELKNKEIYNHIGIAESRNNQGIDANIVVMQVDIKKLTEYLNEANSFLNNLQYQKALEFYFMCVLNDNQGFCQQNKIFRQIGKVYSFLRDSEKAIKYFHKQLDGERDKKGTESDKSWLKDIHASFLLLAKEYEQINKFQKACKFYDLCLKIEYNQEMCLHYASILFNKQRNYKRSIKLFEKTFSQNTNYIYQFDIVYEYLTSLIILRQYLKTYTILEGKIDLSKYTFDAINYKSTNINQQDIIKDWRILFIYRLAYMHSKANLNFYFSFFFQALYEVLITDLYIKNIKNLQQYSQLIELKQSSNTFYQYQFDIDHIELLDSLVNSVSQFKHKYLQNEINQISKIEIQKLKEMIDQQNDQQNNDFLQETICFNRAKNYPDDTQLSIKRIDLYISLFPYLKLMLRFFFSYFHKINRLPQAEYFILYEFKINKNDLSTLQICKILYKKENTKLFTSLLIQFYEANKQELPIDATGLLLEIYVNCKNIKKYEQAANYLHTCLTSKQNTLNLEAKRKLIVQAAYLFFYLGNKDLFFSYYNQINNISQYVQLKIFYYSTIKDYQQVKQIIEKNYLNKKNNQIGNILILEYYTIAILKLGLYQNLDFIYKKLKQATILQKSIHFNYILYSRVLFTNKQYKYVISLLDLDMENLINSLGNQNSDDICQINFYLSLSYFFLKQYDQALKISETFIALYNTKNPAVPEGFKQMFNDLIIVQIISYAKKQQISVAQTLINQHFNELKLSEINLRPDQLAITVAELEYVILKKEIDCLSTLNKEIEVYENTLRKLTSNLSLKIDQHYSQHYLFIIFTKYSDIYGKQNFLIRRKQLEKKIKKTKQLQHNENTNGFQEYQLTKTHKNCNDSCFENKEQLSELKTSSNVDKKIDLAKQMFGAMKTEDSQQATALNKNESKIIDHHHQNSQKSQLELCKDSKDQNSKCLIYFKNGFINHSQNQKSLDKQELIIIKKKDQKDQIQNLEDFLTNLSNYEQNILQTNIKSNNFGDTKNQINMISLFSKMTKNYKEQNQTDYIIKQKFENLIQKNTAENNEQRLDCLKLHLEAFEILLCLGHKEFYLNYIKDIDKNLEILAYDKNKDIPNAYDIILYYNQQKHNLYLNILKEDYDQYMESIKNGSNYQIPNKIPLKDKAIFFYNLGLSQFNIGQYNEAIESFQNSVKIKRNFKDQNSIEISQNLDYLSQCFTHKNIGYCYLYLNEFNKAIEHSQKSLEILRAIFNDDKNSYIADSLNNLGLSQLLSGETQNCLSNMDQELQIRKEFCKELHPDLADSFNCIGFFYFLTQDNIK
ncbi:hypothetical protein ABPG72_015079 [Tetrahymena utriculariae]